MKHGHDCMCCSQGVKAFHDNLDEIIKNVGHAVIGTEIDPILPGQFISMAYTVGLADKGLPELVVFSLPMEHAQIILNTAAEMLKAGKLPIDEPVEGIANMPSVLKRIDPEMTDGYLNIANLRANKNVDALQLVWPDAQGKFPWDPSFNADLMLLQPQLFTQTS